MKKVTLMFPSNDSLWTFKEKSKAINVRIEPKHNRLTGVFYSDEIDVAISQFQAIQPDNITEAKDSATVSSTTKIRRPSFKFKSRLRQLLAVINL